MGTFGSIKTRVLTRVIDATAAVQAEVPALVNEAIRGLERRHNFKVMEAVTASMATTFDNLVLASVPADFKDYRGKPYILPTTGLIVPIGISPAINSTNLAFPERTQTGPPQFIMEGTPSDSGARSWWVFPTPDGNSAEVSGEYDIVVPYWRYLPILINDADTNWFTVNAEEYIVNQATSEAFAVDWDEDRMAIWAQKAENLWKDVKKADIMTSLSLTETLVPSWEGARTPRLDW